MYITSAGQPIIRSPFKFIVPSAVRNFTCSEILQTIITLSWREPEYRNGIIQGYQISVDGRDPEDLDGKAVQKMFEGLRKLFSVNTDII